MHNHSHAGNSLSVKFRKAPSRFEATEIQAKTPQPGPADPTDQVDIVPESPGVYSVPKEERVPLSAPIIAMIVTTNSAIAGSLGSYGVGAALIGPRGELYATSQNHVVKDGEIADPTAHGERQLVDWYFAQKAKGEELPSAEQMTVVSSLDPCIMCAGSILASGMNVVSLSQDPGAGVDYRGDGTFVSLPKKLQKEAKEHFSYFGVENESPFIGKNPLFQGFQLYKNAATLAESDFNSSVPDVSAAFAKLEVSTDEALDPRSLETSEDGQNILAKAKESAQDVLFHRLADPRKPDAVVADKLRSLAEKAKSEGNDYNAAVLVGPFGDILLSAAGKESVSPIRTPVFELSRAYNKLRNAVGDEGKQHFPPFSQCRMVTLQGPSPSGAGIAEIGGFCSSAKGGFAEGNDRHWQYLIQRQTPQQLKKLLDNLPPRYSVERRPDIKQAEIAKEAPESASISFP